jgi:hypothetical protein
VPSPRSRFWQSLVFAVLAGTASFGFVSCAAWWFGYAHSAGLCALASVLAYPWFAGPNARKNLTASALSAAIAAPIAFLIRDGGTLLVLTPVVLGIVRSGVLYPRPLARALVYELGFALFSVGAAWTSYEASLIGVPCAIWTFWLVQSAFALMPSAVREEAASVDPFERAHRLAVSMLERQQ